ncbi:hypothetical protein [Sinorhizobium meliloti]|uniref:hypothetical protein n=1 Tax=Rhizobium meliloti TaxID=382 RepID=UPI0013E354DC|nr:hypothetical protein [Sinorhizobium meliloti]
MFLLPADVDAILEAARPKPKSEPYRPGSDSAELSRLLARLQKEEAAKKLNKRKAPSRSGDYAELLDLREQMKREEAARKKK